MATMAAARTALIISTLIQIPFLILLNRGHSTAGGIGYVFYYPMLWLLDRFPFLPWGHSFEQLQLFVYQSLFSGAIIFAVLVLKRRLSAKPETSTPTREREVGEQ